MDVADGFGELVVGILRGVAGGLRLVCADQVLRGVDDGLVECEHGLVEAADAGGEFGGIGVQPDAHQRIVVAPGGAEFVVEVHIGLQLCYVALNRIQAGLRLICSSLSSRGSR